MLNPYGKAFVWHKEHEACLVCTSKVRLFLHFLVTNRWHSSRDIKKTSRCCSVELLYFTSGRKVLTWRHAEVTHAFAATSTWFRSRHFIGCKIRRTFLSRAKNAFERRSRRAVVQGRTRDAARRHYSPLVRGAALWFVTTHQVRCVREQLDKDPPLHNSSSVT